MIQMNKEREIIENFKKVNEMLSQSPFKEMAERRKKKLEKQDKCKHKDIEYVLMERESDYYDCSHYEWIDGVYSICTKCDKQIDSVELDEIEFDQDSLKKLLELLTKLPKNEQA